MIPSYLIHPIDHDCRSLKESNKFNIAVNVAAGARVLFTLIYDELLSRRLGHYELLLNIDPGMTVPDLKVKVNIVESRAITYLIVPEIRELNENVFAPEGRF